MSNQCRIDAKSTPDEGRARRIRGWGLGWLCLINPSQSWTSKRRGPKCPREICTKKFAFRSVCRLSLWPFDCNGHIAGQPRKGNVDKMSEKCRKNVRKCLKNVSKHNFRTFLDNFCIFGRCFCLVTLSNACPLQPFDETHSALFWGKRRRFKHNIKCMFGTFRENWGKSLTFLAKMRATNWSKAESLCL